MHKMSEQLYSLSVYMYECWYMCMHVCISLHSTGDDWFQVQSLLLHTIVTVAAKG